MKYSLNRAGYEAVKQKEVNVKKKPLFNRFLKQFILFIIVMILGLSVSYLAYIKLGIYSPRNLFCFILGIALFSMGFQQLFSRIGFYVDAASGIKPLIWDLAIYFNDFSIPDATIEEIEDGYKLVVHGIKDYTRILSPETVYNIIVNKDCAEKQAVFFLSEKAGKGIAINSAMFVAKNEEGKEVFLNPSEMVSKLMKLGVSSVYATDQEFINDVTHASTHRVSEEDITTANEDVVHEEGTVTDKEDSTGNNEEVEKEASETETSNTSYDYKTSEEENKTDSETSENGDSENTTEEVATSESEEDVSTVVLSEDDTEEESKISSESEEAKSEVNHNEKPEDK